MTQCTNQCVLNAKQCSGTGVQTCTVMPSGCTDWGIAVACTGGQTCSGGQCVAVVPDGGSSLADTGPTPVDSGTPSQDAGAGPDAGTSADASTSDPAACEWARWPAPPSEPPATQYQISSSGASVTDTATNLTWELAATSTTRTWADASAYCASLTLDGLTGWRVPTLIELESIVSQGKSSPATNHTVFSNTAVAQAWTSTNYRPISAGTAAWMVDFNFGDTGGLFRDVPRPVRCVTGTCAPTAGRYVIRATTVVDTVTHLTWQRDVSPNTLSASEAQSYCNSLVLGGANWGWRVPTLKELQTLVDVSRVSPSIDTTAFPRNATSILKSLRSSNPCVAPNYGYSWVVLFDHGDTFKLEDGNGSEVRCVWPGELP
ncbi:MAG: DUF1566 domain-containing protein [Myxococcales bacterium]